MYEITENDLDLLEICKQKDLAYVSGTYDFTFENRFLIYHAPMRHQIAYIALDRQTGRASEVCSGKKIYSHYEYTELIPRVLRAIEYTGDRRSRSPRDIDAENKIDLIFRTILPLYGFRIREEQIRLSKQIFEGLRDKKAAICEAEVGTGKTMAYLVAGLCENYRRDISRFLRHPVTIVTSSIELQTAIMGKEIPLLNKVLMQAGLIGRPLNAVLRKGKEHYLCPSRYAAYIKRLSSEPKKYGNLLSFFETSEFSTSVFDLDRVRLPGIVKSYICVKGSCKHCSKNKTCRYAAFVRDSLESKHVDIQVVNHNMYLMSTRIPGLLQSGSVVIIDEAHKLKEAAQDVFGKEIGERLVEKYLNWIRHKCREKTDRAIFTELCSEADMLNRALFAQLRRQGELEQSEAEDSCALDRLSLKAVRLIIKLTEKLQRLESLTRDMFDHQEMCVKKLCEDLMDFLLSDDKNIWVSIDENGETVLHCCPKELGQQMNRFLWAGPSNFALLSGTMSDGKSFQFFKRENGLDLLPQKDVLEDSIQSPFDFKNHARLYIPNDLPLPSYDNPAYFQTVADRVVELVQATNGHTAILFTSYQMLHKIHELTKDRLGRYEVICMGKNNKTAIVDFKKSKNGVLFASGSMWEGVDCAGDVLSSVIIVRLPFPLRTVAMEQKKEKCSTIREFIDEYAVPEMLIKLRQGAGRLIRGEMDTGVLSILDGRAAEGSHYHEQIIQALVKYPLVTSVEEVAAFIDQVKNNTYKNA